MFGGNTQQSAEGTVGSPITESSTKIVATMGQYSDYINSSDLAMDVAIDDPSLLQNLATELNYRLALTLNSLVQITADSATTTDSSVNIQLANGSFLTANNLRTASQQLAGVNARPLTSDGYYGGIIHPFVVHDLLNDTSFNGLSDIIKRGADAQKLFAPLQNEQVIEFAGIKFKQTTTAPTTTIAGNTYYQTYVTMGQAA